jgi:hypothetical protein
MEEEIRGRQRKIEDIRGRQRTLLCEQCFSLSGYCPYLIFKYITLQNIFLAFGDYFLIPPSSIIHEIPPSYMKFYLHGNFGYLSKSGFRFSRKARPPS